MRRIYLSLMIALILAKGSYSQEALTKDEVYTKIQQEVIRYGQVSNFTKDDFKNRVDFENRLKRMNFDSFVFVINDLPIPGKSKVKVSVDEYAGLLYNHFENGLSVEIDTSNLEIHLKQDDFDSTIWRGDVLFLKKLTGKTADNQVLHLDVDTRLEFVVEEGEFLITSVSCPNDWDADGVPNEEDDCPERPGFLQDDGCADSDNDGVPDKLDRCPGTPHGVSVDEFGCPVTASFFSDVNWQINFIPSLNRHQHFQAKDVTARYFKINDFEKWTDDGNEGPAWPFTPSFEVKLTKPAVNFANSNLGITTGVGFYSYKSKLFVYEIKDGRSFPEIGNEVADYELSTFNYIGMPVGIKFSGQPFYIETGVNNLISVGGKREVLLENGKSLEGIQDNIKASLKSYVASPYLGFGIQQPLNNRKMGIHAGFKLAFVNNFNEFNRNEYNRYDDGDNRMESVLKEDLPVFIEMVDKLKIHSVSFDLGIIFNLNTPAP